MSEAFIQNTFDIAVRAQQSGRLEEADRHYTSILKVDPFHPDCNHNMGILAMQVRKYHRGLGFLLVAIENRYDVKQYWISLITCLQKLKCDNEIAGVMATANRLNDNFLSTNKTFSVLEARAKEYGKSKFSPLTLTLRSNILKTLLGKSEFERVIEISDAFLEHHEQRHIIYGIKAAALVQLNKHQAAILSLKKAVELEPKFANGHYNLGKIYFACKMYRQSISSYLEAIALTDNVSDFHRDLGLSYKNIGDLVSAISSFEKCLKIDEKNPSVLIDVGNINYELGHYETAIKFYIKAASFTEKKSDALYNLGVVLNHLGRLTEAIDAYKGALALKADNSLAGNNLGNIYYNSGDYTRAVETYLSIIKFNPKHAETYYNLGLTYKKIGKLELAIESLERAINLNSNHVEAKYMLDSLRGARDVSTAPREYVERLFDGYAKNFESNLLDNLKYDAPKEIARLLELETTASEFLNILDLGCGTGLMAEHLSLNCGKVSGVDLSRNMLSIAEAKGNYAQLYNMSVEEFILSENLKHDLILAVDLFIYVGDLDFIFNTLIERNRCKMFTFAFTTEHSDGLGYQLQASGRFSHSLGYIEHLSSKYGYVIEHHSVKGIRLEDGDWISGGYYILKYCTE